MKAAFAGCFVRDIRKLPDATIREQVQNAILTVEAAPGHSIGAQPEEAQRDWIVLPHPEGD